MKKILFFIIALIFVQTNTFAQYSVIISSPVNLRELPNTNGKIAATLNQNLIIADFVEESKEKQELKIWNRPYDLTWSKVALGSLEAYIYSLFVVNFDSYAKAEEFVANNKEFQATQQGSKILTKEYLESAENLSSNISGVEMHYFNSEFDYRFNFEADGKFEVEIEGLEGDHFVMEKGVGRYLVFPDKILFRAALKGEFAPEGYTWAEYYELDVGGKPTAKQLAKYKKEKGTYRLYFELTIPLKDYSKAFRNEED